MRNFQIWWLKFCCFLTGYNFYILSNCSEISSRKTKKYAAALLIVATVWAFVGYCFCNRYIKLDVVGSLVGALISVLLIVQIEKQILLTEKTNWQLKWTRFGLAMLMAILGSLIIDQIIFKDDIEKSKMESNQTKVNALMPGKSIEINNQIRSINKALDDKETERRKLLEDINKNPTIQIVETSSNQVPINKTIIDSSKNEVTNTVLKNAISRNIRVIQNPKFAQLQPIDSQIATLNSQKTVKENTLLSLKKILEDDVNSKIGFLDELKVMLNLLKESAIALIVYLIWFLFLLLLELLILIGKSNDTESDYDKTIQKQMAIHFKKIDLL